MKNGDILIVDVDYHTCTIRQPLYYYDNYLFESYLVDENEFCNSVDFADGNSINIIQNTGINIFNIKNTEN